MYDDDDVSMMKEWIKRDFTPKIAQNMNHFSHQIKWNFVSAQILVPTF